MDHESHICFVDAHAEGDRGYDDLDLAREPGLVDRRFGVFVKDARVVE
jgi:hypothetical protein